MRRRNVICAVIIVLSIAPVVAAPPGNAEENIPVQVPAQIPVQVPGMPSHVTPSVATQSTMADGSHYVTHASIIGPVNGSDNLQINHGSVEIGPANLFLDTAYKGDDAILSSQPLIIDTTQTTLDTSKVRVDAPVNVANNDVLGAGYLQGNGSTFTLQATGHDVTLEAGDAVVISDDGAETMRIRPDGSFSFDTGTAADRFTTTFTGSGDHLPTGNAVTDYTEQRIAEAMQDLSFVNNNAPTGAYSSHEVKIDNGASAMIRDYFDPDNQTLTFTSEPNPVDNQVDHQLGTTNGNSVSVVDYYDVDTTIPDNQGLSLSRSGSDVTIDIDNGTPTTVTDKYYEYTAGDGVNLAADNTFSLTLPSCADDQVLTWTSGSFSCEEELREVTPGQGVKRTDPELAVEAGTGLRDTGSGHAVSAVGTDCTTGYADGFDTGSVSCSTLSSGITCGDGRCHANENPSTCPADCGAGVY